MPASGYQRGAIELDNMWAAKDGLKLANDKYISSHRFNHKIPYVMFILRGRLLLPIALNSRLVEEYSRSIISSVTTEDLGFPKVIIRFRQFYNLLSVLWCTIQQKLCVNWFIATGVSVKKSSQEFGHNSQAP